jgi:dihydrodipicolinate synthase/N-acetylneuraminate lyase
MLVCYSAIFTLNLQVFTIFQFPRMTDFIDPVRLLQPRRKIKGISAILLPLFLDGTIDWISFDAHVERTLAAGLTPAVNMDTGYVNLLSHQQQDAVLARTQAVTGGQAFVAGAFVNDNSGDTFDLSGYGERMDAIVRHGGTPVIFQSFGLVEQSDAEVAKAYQQIGSRCDQFIGFELGQMFAPFGRIYSLELYEQLMRIPQCIGAKHSSLDRVMEWQRLELRNSQRADFHVFTGNDLAIDMVMYGSDYLLGLSTFAPDLFALRDRYWLEGDPRFYEANDLLQYLGFFAFRPPVPAYKHSAAMLLRERGWIQSDLTHPKSPKRPPTDREVLADICRRIKTLTGE